MEKIKDLLQAAQGEEKRGHLEAALLLYGRIVALFPNSTRAKKAALSLRKKLGHPREIVQADVVQMNALVAEENYAAAIDILGVLLTVAPKHTGLYNSLGVAFLRTGANTKAAEAFSSAINLDPNNFEALDNLGSTYILLGNEAKAEPILRKAITTNPNYARAHHNLSVILMNANKFDEALNSVNRSLQIAGLNPLAIGTKVLVLQALGRDFEAADVLRKTLVGFPREDKLKHQLGKIYSQLGRNEDALEILEPFILNDSGEWTTDKEYFGALASTCSQLVRLKKIEADSPILTLCHAMLDTDPEDPSHRANLLFTLYWAYEDLGEYDRAFNCLLEANRLVHENEGYDHAFYIEEAKRAKADVETPIYAPGKLEVYEDVEPIFIVGMPRSGTTLVEQILASHSEVYGAGELADISNIRRHYFSDTEKNGPVFVDRIACNYLERNAILAEGKSRFVDKMPHNFQNIGLILRLFPNAKIIQMLRDPRDVCYSIFRIRFASRGHPYSFDQNNLADHYRHYLDMMDFWHKTFPGQIYTCAYERLVREQDTEIHRLIKFCDLPWEGLVMEFHKSKRAVKTASKGQVKSKIYTSSVSGWRRYEEGFAPLVTRLEENGALARFEELSAEVNASGEGAN